MATVNVKQPHWFQHILHVHAGMLPFHLRGFLFGKHESMHFEEHPFAPFTPAWCTLHRVKSASSVIFRPDTRLQQKVRVQPAEVKPATCIINPRETTLYVKIRAASNLIARNAYRTVPQVSRVLFQVAPTIANGQSSLEC